MLSNIIIILALFVSFVIGALTGGYIVGTKDLHIEVSDKLNYAEKTRELEEIMDKLLLETPDEDRIPAGELFPPGINKDFGIPRKL